MRRIAARIAASSSRSFGSSLRPLSGGQGLERGDPDSVLGRLDLDDLVAWHLSGSQASFLSGIVEGMAYELAEILDHWGHLSEQRELQLGNPLQGSGRALKVAHGTLCAVKNSEAELASLRIDLIAAQGIPRADSEGVEQRSWSFLGHV